MTQEEGSSDTPITAVGAANAIVNSSIGKALFLRPATALGEYWGDLTLEKIEQWKQKRQANVALHVEAVKLNFPNSAPHSERRERLQQEWVEHAEEIDPSVDIELSSIWQGILHSIMANDTDAQDILNVSRSITPREAKIILKNNRMFLIGDNNVREIKSLVDKGLMQRKLRFNPPSSYLFLLSLLAFILYTLMFFSIYYTEFEVSPISGRTAFSTFILASFSFFLILGVASLGIFQRTLLGSRLTRYALRYSKAGSTPKTQG